MTARRARIAGVVLAAGSSRRMGAPNKLLAPLGDGPIVVQTVRALVNAGLSPVVVVTGHDSTAVEATLQSAGPSRVQTVFNPRHADGMGTSLAAGVSALRGRIDGVLVALGDMPHVRSETVSQLVSAWQAAGPSFICVPTFDGVRGNPVLFGAEHLPRLASSDGDVGARNLLAEHPQLVRDVAVEDPGVVRDIDTPADLQSALNPQGFDRDGS